MNSKSSSLHSEWKAWIEHTKAL